MGKAGWKWHLKIAFPQKLHLSSFFHKNIFCQLMLYCKILWIFICIMGKHFFGTRGSIKCLEGVGIWTLPLGRGKTAPFSHAHLCQLCYELHWTELFKTTNHRTAIFLSTLLGTLFCWARKRRREWDYRHGQSTDQLMWPDSYSVHGYYSWPEDILEQQKVSFAQLCGTWLQHCCLASTWQGGQLLSYCCVHPFLWTFAPAVRKTLC